MKPLRQRTFTACPSTSLPGCSSFASAARTASITWPSFCTMWKRSSTCFAWLACSFTTRR